MKSARGFEIIGSSSPADGELLYNPPSLPNRQTVKFYAREASFLSKLPLAATVYVAFEFFFINQRRNIADEYDDENFEWEDYEFDDEVKELSEFWTVVVLRCVAAFVITSLTMFVSTVSF